MNFFEDWEGQEHVQNMQTKLMEVFGTVGVLFSAGTYYTSFEFVLPKGRKLIMGQNLPDPLITEGTHAELHERLRMPRQQVRLHPDAFEVFVDYLLENHS